MFFEQWYPCEHVVVCVVPRNGSANILEILLGVLSSLPVDSRAYSIEKVGV